METRPWFIYVLIDPRTDAIRYVGWSVDVTRRVKFHACPSQTKRTHKGKWIRSLMAIGLRPLYRVIETGDGTGDEWAACERKWIAFYRKQGCDLTNLTDGGDGTLGHKPTVETRFKMSTAAKRVKHTDERNYRISTALRGVQKSKEHVAKMSAASKGNKSQPIATAAAALVNRGRHQSPEHVEKRTSTLIGKPSKCRKLTDEQVVAIRRLRGKVPLRKRAAMFDVGPTVIHSIDHRLHYANVPG